jgi:hypothetical protein
VSCRTISERGSPAPSPHLASWFIVDPIVYLADLNVSPMTQREFQNWLTQSWRIVNTLPRKKIVWDFEALPRPEKAKVNSDSLRSTVGVVAYRYTTKGLLEIQVEFDLYRDCDTLWTVLSYRVMPSPRPLSQELMQITSLLKKLVDATGPRIKWRKDFQGCARPASTVSDTTYQALFDQLVDANAYQQ